MKADDALMTMGVWLEVVLLETLVLDSVPPVVATLVLAGAAVVVLLVLAVPEPAGLGAGGVQLAV